MDNLSPGPQRKLAGNVTEMTPRVVAEILPILGIGKIISNTHS